MAETISLDVKGRVPKKLLNRIYTCVTPKYVRALLKENGMPTERYTLEMVTTSYHSFPTEDLALRTFETNDGIKFWGIASGSGAREERVAVKYLILRYIQDELAKSGIKSDINIADLNPETIKYMNAREMFKGKLKELKNIAERMGNLENITIGIAGALVTPV